MSPFSSVHIEPRDLPGLGKAVEMLRELERLAGHTHEANDRRRAYKHARELITVEADAAAQAAVAYRSGSEVADLGRVETEGPYDGDEEATGSA